MLPILKRLCVFSVRKLSVHRNSRLKQTSSVHMLSTNKQMFSKLPPQILVKWAR